MNIISRSSALAVGLFACQLAFAQTPAPKPANATGICKDGTYTTNATKSGACGGHHGVQQWYAAAATPAPAPAAKTAAPTPASAPPAVATAPSTTTQVRTQSQAAAQSAAQSNTPPATQSLKNGPAANAANAPVAPGGGSGLVWVNTSSKTYHCPGTTYYGKTKQGSYMTEAAAKAQGAHANHGQSCSK
jgi:hypothetical protein